MFLWGPVHTNPFSNENGAVLLRIRVSSTLQRRKRSPKTESFENALQNGAIWKRCFLKTLLSNVDGKSDAIWKRWRHPNRHDRAPAHSTVSIQNGEQTVPSGFSLDDRCSVDGRKRYENDKCGRKSFWKRSKTASFSFENGLVWTGPESARRLFVSSFYLSSLCKLSEIGHIEIQNILCNCLQPFKKIEKFKTG